MEADFLLAYHHHSHVSHSSHTTTHSSPTRSTTTYHHYMNPVMMNNLRSHSHTTATTQEPEKDLEGFKADRTGKCVFSVIFLVILSALGGFGVYKVLGLFDKKKR